VNARVAIVAAFAAICFIWGTTWFAIRVALQYLPPITGVGIRFILAGLIMYAIAASCGRLRLRGIPWTLVVVYSIFLFGLNYMLSYAAETHLGSGVVAVLFGTQPFFVFAFGYLLARERTTSVTWIGAAIALAGVATISFNGDVRAALPCAAAAIGSAAVSAFGVAYAKRESATDPFITLPPAMLLGGVATFAIGLAFERPSFAHALAPGSVGAVLYLTLLGSCTAFFLSLWLLQRIDASIFALNTLITPVIAVIVGVTIGAERFDARALLGAALVILGVWLALRSSRRPVQLTEELGAHDDLRYEATEKAVKQARA
jgi:drug/metabolite transporter (DMT)-like permease